MTGPRIVGLVAASAALVLVVAVGMRRQGTEDEGRSLAPPADTSDVAPVEESLLSPAGPAPRVASATAAGAQDVATREPRAAAGETPRARSGANLWSARYRLVDELGTEVTLQSLQSVGIGYGRLQVHWSSSDGESGTFVVPDMGGELPLEGGLKGELGGPGELPVQLVLRAGEAELGRAELDARQGLVDLRADLGALRERVRRVTFRTGEGALVRVNLRGADRLESYWPRSMPTLDYLDGTPGHPGEREITVGLPAGSYGYEADVYDLPSRTNRRARGVFEVAGLDLVVDVGTAGTGTLEGAVDPGGAQHWFVQVLPIGRPCVDCTRLATRGDEDRYRVDELSPGDYHVVAFALDAETKTASLGHAERVEITAGQTAQLDLSIGTAGRALEEWVLRADVPTFSLTIVEIAPDGTRLGLLDLPGGAAPGMRLALPRGANLEFRASPGVETRDAAGTDFSRTSLGVPNERGEVWFRFGE